MNKLCDTADKLMEVMIQDNLVACARTPSDDIIQIQEQNKLWKRQIGDLTKKKKSTIAKTPASQFVDQAKRKEQYLLLPQEIQ